MKNNVLLNLMMAARPAMFAAEYKALEVHAPDNITLQAQEWGIPVVNSYLSWEPQYESSLARISES